MAIGLTFYAVAIMCLLEIFIPTLKRVHLFAYLNLGVHGKKSPCTECYVEVHGAGIFLSYRFVPWKYTNSIVQVFGESSSLAGICLFIVTLCSCSKSIFPFCVKRSFPLTEEEYLLRLDDVANTLKCWGAVSHIRSSLAKLKERPRIGKVRSWFEVQWVF